MLFAMKVPFNQQSTIYFYNSTRLLKGKKRTYENQKEIEEKENSTFRLSYKHYNNVFSTFCMFSSYMTCSFENAIKASSILMYYTLCIV